jgi:hypothetical protein
MIKFRDYYEKQFWMQLITLRFGHGNWGNWESIRTADWIIERLREREDDQAVGPETTGC